MQGLQPHVATPPAIAPNEPSRPFSARRAAGIVSLAYLIAYVALVVLLLGKPASFGEFGDPRLLGTIFVTITLVPAFLASMAWVASPRLAALIGGLALVFIGVANLGNLAVGLALLGFGGVAAYAGLAALRRPSGPTNPPSIPGRVVLPLIALAVIASFWLQEIGRL